MSQLKLNNPPNETNINDFEKIDWDFINSNKKENLHSIHPYPAKFIPEIPRTLINIIKPDRDEYIFDPFCGSGVTLVEAQRLGFQSLGVDLNPIATLISRVKTSPLPKEFILIIEKVLKIARSLETEESPNIPRLNHWFKEEIQIALLRLRKAIKLASEDQLQKDILEFMLSSIIVTVSNQDSDTRYAAVSNDLNLKDVFDKFEMASKKTLKYLYNREYNLLESSIHQSDIFEFDSDAFENKVGLVITSPPYPNAYEYWLYHKYRMYWLDYDPQFVKEREIGARAHYYKKYPPTKEDFVNQMDSLFSLFGKVLTKKGKVAMVIGRSKIHGEIIDNTILVEEGANRNNFNLTQKIPRHIKSSRKSFNLGYSGIKAEHILIFN
jgi:site-specific DNA-methyltransferase (cytosine-N4-specific)